MKTALPSWCEEAHLADLILDVIWLHTPEDVTREFVRTALSIVISDVDAEFDRERNP